MSFETMFANEPVGRTMRRHWAMQDESTLDAAADVIEAHGANPWVFSADARCFWQFSGAREVAAMQAMTPAQFAAVVGDWDEEDHDPATFGYAWPQ